MIEKIKISQLDDYFLKLSERNLKGSFFNRMNKYSPEIQDFLIKYVSSIKVGGIWINSKMKNPDDQQLLYYQDMVGTEFALNLSFFSGAIRLMLPGLDNTSAETLSKAIYDELDKLHKLGKNENILKNTFVKYMCWIYYRFRFMIEKIGRADNVQKILYDGEISYYELSMLSILAKLGCDVLLIRYGGEEKYRQNDSLSEISDLYEVRNGSEFPQDFALEAIQKLVEERSAIDQLYVKEKLRIPATNIWLHNDVFEDILKKDEDRGNNNELFYNAFIRITGVENKSEYCKNLFHFKSNIERNNKTVLVLEKITPPTPEEVSKIQPGNYMDMYQMIGDLAKKIRCPYPELKNQVKKAFIDCIMEENSIEQGNLNRLKSKAIYLVAWFSRYGRQLFTKEKETSLPVLIYFGVCKNSAETMMFRFFASLPLDVILINSNTQNQCMLTDDRLYEQRYDDSLELDKFPEKIEEVNYATVAYHAEQDLNTVLYQDSGLYRNQQYKDAVAVTLKIMYEELYLLWNQEVNMRPNFEIIHDKVVMPAIVVKVCGVKKEDVNQYWKDVKKLLVEDCILIDNTKFYQEPEEHFDARNAIKNNVLQKASIVRNKNYKYGIFREEIQEYMLERLQEFLDSGLVRGTYTGGAEYKIISIIMNLDKNITRLIQKMDFTRINPKLVLINTGEEEYGEAESIVLAYLHFIGFDIALFVPTGYRVIEKYYTQPFFAEHQIGEFIYDMKVPSNVQGNKLNAQEEKEGFLKRLLRR